MMADPRLRTVATSVHSGWLGSERLAGMTKDPKLFAGYTAEIGATMKTALDRFVDRVVFDSNGTVAALFDTPEAFVTDKLAAYYRVPAPAPGKLEQVALDPTLRAGLLTQVGVLAMTSKAAETSPVKRGVFVREVLLCADLPPPLPNAAQKLPSPSPNATTRERFTQHSVDPTCAACHRLIDPVGFALEGFDAIGQSRTTENNKTIDTSGELVEVDVPGKVDGAVALSKRLAASAQTRQCVERQWFAQAFGLEATAADTCVLRQIDVAFVAGGGHVRDLMRFVAGNAAFAMRQGDKQ
jgi:hypothetical protein